MAEKRYIDASRLSDLEEMEYIYFQSPAAIPYYEAHKVWEILDSIPDADVAEVKHGEWLTPQNDTIRGQKFTCSVCGKIAYYPQPTRLKNWVKHCSYEYCPHCGAKMDGKGER